MEKLLKFDRPVEERFYAFYREQFSPGLTVADSVVEEWSSVGSLERKKESPPNRNKVVDSTFAEKARR